MCGRSNRLPETHGDSRGRHSRLPCAIVGLLATGILICGCVPSQKCTVQQMMAGQRLATLVHHLKRDEDPSKAPSQPPWAHSYPEVLRGEYAVEGSSIKFTQGGVVYGRDSFLQRTSVVFGPHDIVVVASPEYIGCGSKYVVVYGDAHYRLVSPESAEFTQSQQFLDKWSGGLSK